MNRSDCERVARYLEGGWGPTVDEGRICEEWLRELVGDDLAKRRFWDTHLCLPHGWHAIRTERHDPVFVTEGNGMVRRILATVTMDRLGPDGRIAETVRATSHYPNDAEKAASVRARGKAYGRGRPYA